MSAIGSSEFKEAFMAALDRIHERYLIGLEGVKEVWLIRHGDAYTDVASLGESSLDPPLSEVGRRQAALLGRRLAEARIRSLWSSDLGRARETATLASGSLPGVQIAVDPRLREVRTHWDAGLLPPAPKSRGEDEFPFLEDERRVVARMHEIVLAISRNLVRIDEPRAAAVSHAAAIGAYVAHLLGLPYGKLPILPQYTSVTVLRVLGERVVVESLADISHRIGEDVKD